MPKSGIPAYPYLKLRGKGAARRSTLGTRKPLPPIYDAADFSPHDPDPRLGAGLTDPAKPAPARAVPASSSASKAAVKRGVRNSVKSVEPARDYDHFLGRLSSKNTAANLLRSAGQEKLSVRVSQCIYVRRQPVVSLQVSKETGRASVSGIVTCSSVWCCPCCSPRISARRKDELDKLMSGARAEGLSVVMLTLTARHNRRMALAPFLDDLKSSKQRLQQLTAWRNLKPVMVGSVTATEVTHGDNGFHPHFHCLLVLDAPQEQALAMVEGLRSAWIASLATFGLEGEKAAFHVQDASAAQCYVAKFGAAEELALQGSKRGRNGSRGPWELLEAARDGDLQAGAIWQEYAAAFRGRRQLVWSRGLKARFGVDEVSDDEAAATDETTHVVVRQWTCGRAWREARRRLASLLFAAETGGDLDRAEFGPTDARRWAAIGGFGLLESPD